MTALFDTTVKEVWDFDNDATAEKSSTYDGTAVGTTPTFGTTSPDVPQGSHYVKCGGAGRYDVADGAGSIFRINGGDWALAFWMYPNVKNPGHLICIGDKNIGDIMELDARYISSTNYSLDIKMRDNWTGVEETLGSLNFNDIITEWTHVVISHDVSASTATFWYSAAPTSFSSYDDTNFGSIENGGTQASLGSSWGDTNVHPFRIGGRHTSSGPSESYFDGHLDEVAFFDQTLTAAQAKEIYLGTQTGGWREAAGGGGSGKGSLMLMGVGT